MKFSPLLAEELAPSENTSFIITPRRRLARQIMEEYIRAMSFSVAHRPNVITINDWIILQGESILQEKGKQLMNPAQSAIIWQEALNEFDLAKIAAGLDEFGTLNAQGSSLKKELVAQARDAWRKAHLYNISISKQDFADEKIPKFFLQWSNLYRDICMERGLCDEWMLLELLGAAVIGEDVRPDPSLWVGFSRPYPAYEDLYKALKNKRMASKTDYAFVDEDKEQRISKQTSSADSLSEARSQPSFGSLVTLRQYDNEEDELKSIAEEIRDLHLKERDKSIGVIVPNMEQNWHKVRRLFMEVFAEEIDADNEHQGTGALDQPKLPFDMSWGEELGNYPLIGDLLNLLHLGPERKSPSSFIALFNSPYINGHFKEQDARANLDIKLCELARTYSGISVSKIANINRTARAKHSNQEVKLFDKCEILRRSLKKYFSVMEAYKYKANPRHWARVFNDQAQALGWGDIEWSRSERQLWDKWIGMLDELNCAGNFTAEMTRSEAIDFLSSCATSIFQPSPPDTGIKILGISEAEGLRFDYLFACHLHSGCVHRPGLNFFIPYELSLASSMVGNRTHIENQQWIIGDLRQAAPRVFLSFASLAGDEDRVCHPMLDDLEAESISSTPKNIEAMSIKLEILDDYKAPPVTDKEELHGLIGIVKSHSNCPFQSFISNRINPKIPEGMEEEFSPLERGIIFHKLMSEIWAEVENQKTLLSLTDKEFKQLINKHVNRELNASKSVFLKDDITFRLEKILLTELAARLLSYEKTREKDFIVKHTEKESEITLGNDKFFLKIDRMDQLIERTAAGAILIDYKLGNSKYNAKSVLGPRPSEPQLIIYSMLVDDICSLGFISINYKQECDVSGLYIEEDGMFSMSGKHNVTVEELDACRDIVRELYDSFVGGQAAVDPRNSEVCRYCKYSPLCRVQELNYA